MPPRPTYNWLCAASSVADILGHAVQHRAQQLARVSANVHPCEAGPPATRIREEIPRENKHLDSSIAIERVKEAPGSNHEPSNVVPDISPIRTTTHFEVLQAAKLPDVLDTTEIQESIVALEDAPHLEPPFVQENPIPSEIYDTPPEHNQMPLHRATLHSSKVPSSKIARFVHYGGLAASLGFGAATELLRRTTDTSTAPNSAPLMMTEANIKRLVSKLSQMRGAALKLGQFLSIQDTHLLPPEIDKIFRRVQDSAHYMPDWQLEQVLTSSLGSNWSSSFESFDRVPFAAASIGQVHQGVLTAKASPTGHPEAVAIKIQFPNIADSIDSDLGYIKWLLTAGRLLPPGLFLEKTVSVMKGELADECDYTREASFLRSFRSNLGTDPRYKVPWVWDGSTQRVLVMERVEGISVGEAQIREWSQRDRNDIASRILELCLKELFQFRQMQTDPNWSNFLWNEQTKQVELVDFGATREYTKEFMDKWLKLLTAAALEDREECIKQSLKLGYLTGKENETMLNAHVKSMVLLAAPFRVSTPQPFSFGKGTMWEDITLEIRKQIPIMLQHRLTPPPPETYSLNRKLSGAFLLAARLGATFDTKAIWDSVIAQYEYTT